MQGPRPGTRARKAREEGLRKARRSPPPNSSPSSGAWPCGPPPLGPHGLARRLPRKLAPIGQNRGLPLVYEGGDLDQKARGEGMVPRVEEKPLHPERLPLQGGLPQARQVDRGHGEAACGGVVGVAVGPRGRRPPGAEAASGPGRALAAAPGRRRAPVGKPKVSPKVQPQDPARLGHLLLPLLRGALGAHLPRVRSKIPVESPSALARARVPPQPSSPSSGWGATTKRSSIPFLQNPPKRLRERGHLVGHNIPKGSVVQGEVGVG